MNEAPAKAEHTPLPWMRVEGTSIILGAVGASGECPLVAGQVKELKKHFFELPPPNPDEVRRANAALIVECVNTHRALVELVHELYDLCARTVTFHGNRGYGSVLMSHDGLRERTEKVLREAGVA